MAPAEQSKAVRGARTGALRGRLQGARGAWLGVIAALPMAIYLRGFTVDDALIPARYAAHIARGLGYRFNAAGPVTDGVTPLGWAYALAPFAREGPLAALSAAKVMGFVAWIAGAAALGIAIDRASDRPSRFAPLALLAASAPLGAWSFAGLETGVVTALGALAAALPSLGVPRAGALCAGLCAALRPEMLPWALVLGAASVFAPARSLSSAPVSALASPSPEVAPAGGLAERRWAIAAHRIALAGAPFLLVALIRAYAFGRAAPLSAVAKPADVALGARYALACFLLTGPPSLLAPIAWTRLAAWPRGLVVAAGAHFVAIALAGGDWMPLSRLAVPVLPTVVLAAAYIASEAGALVGLARIAAALGGEVFVLARVGPAAAGVMEDRLAVVEELRGPLSQARVVAALDVGWLGAAAPHATIVDLAGVTDPVIAALPGGHTTKQIPPALLDARGVDTIVLLLAEGETARTPWTESRFARGVEQRIAWFPEIGREFEPVAQSSVEHVRYLVVVRRPTDVARR